MGNLKEEIAKEQDLAYKYWKERNDEKFRKISRNEILQYGFASVFCHGYAEHKTSEKVHILRWCKENGFSTWETTNSYGAPKICWN